MKKERICVKTISNKLTTGMDLKTPNVQRPIPRYTIAPTYVTHTFTPLCPPS